MARNDKSAYLCDCGGFRGYSEIASHNNITMKQKGRVIMDYISAPEAARKWFISERRIQKLCEENRIPGVVQISRMWLIPKDAKNP